METKTEAPCGICDRPAVAEIAPGKPVCATCLAMPVEERRTAGLRRMFSDETRTTEPRRWCCLTFVDGHGYVGACWVEAHGIIDACLVSKARGCNPGGDLSVQYRPMHEHGEPPTGSAYVLHRDMSEVDRLLAAWLRVDPAAAM
jgi:hypothetical protein